MPGLIAPGVPIWLTLAAFGAAALVSFGVIRLLWPWLKRYALAMPNARSSHRVPTPQGGGIAVVAATLMVVTIAFVVRDLWPGGQAAQWTAVAAATLLLAITGAIDDIRDLGAASRLGFQFAAVALVIAMLPADARVVAWLPWWIERLVLVLAGVWFVNLVNFMDGIDWMTVAEVVPITGGLVLLGALGALPAPGIVAASALGGAMVGFAPYNRPVARLFLGDVGSLPVGLVLAWLLFLLAAQGHLAAAVLLPLYYLADTAITLLRRLLRAERLWQAHRSHFYQQATARGLAVGTVVARVLLVNLVLVAIAAATVVFPSIPAAIIALAIGGAVVGVLLAWMARATP